MNTDNFSILGLTLDYGPYQFLDHYDPNYISNTSDETGRYSFRKQPEVAFWNCSRLALALRPLIQEEVGDSLQIQQHLLDVLKKYSILYDMYYKQEMLSKLGLFKVCDSDMTDLVYPLLDILKGSKVDYTIFFRNLCSLSDHEFKGLFPTMIDMKPLSDWMKKLDSRLEKEEISSDERIRRMLLKNPRIIPRNHHLQSIIDNANSGNYDPLMEYWNAIKEPYSPKWNNSIWAQAPTGENKGIRCSCSS